MGTLARVALGLVLASCTNRAAPEAPTPPSLAEVRVTVEVTAMEVGQATRARVATFDPRGAPIAAGPAVFSSSAPEIAGVQPARGDIFALAAGTTDVIATVDGKAGHQTITVSGAAIRINEVAPGDGWVELYNPTASAVELAGWTITAGDVSQSWTVPAGAAIAAGGTFVIEEASFPVGLRATDAVHLFSRFGVQADAFAWAEGAAVSYERCPDGGGGFRATATPTKGAPNGCRDEAPPDPRCQVAWTDLQVGTAQDDQVLGMTIDADDNLVVSGFENGVVGVTNIEPDGDARAVVLKVDRTGSTTWRAVLDTAATDTAEDVAIDPATGALWVLGRTSGAFPTFANQGQFDLVLAALEPDGRIASVFQTGNERPQHPARLSVGRGGGIAVAGWDDTFVDGNHVAAQQNGFVATFTVGPGLPGAPPVVTPASLQYQLPPSPTGPFGLATATAADPDDGSVYVTSRLSMNRSSTQGIFVTKLRPDQSVAWIANLSPVSMDAANAVAISPSGALFVTGGTLDPSGVFGSASFGGEDAFLAKLDRTTGTVIWTARAGGAGTDYPTALAFDPQGAVYIAGSTLSEDAAANHGGFDVFSTKFSDGGALVSSWQTGTAADDQATSLAVDRCGRVFVGGFTRGAMGRGSVNAGGQDMFVVKAAFSAPRSSGLP